MNITRLGKLNMSYFSHLIGDGIPVGQAGLGVIYEDKAVAAALFSYSEGICTLEHIFVDPSYRRMGIGTFLLKDAIETFAGVGADTVLVYYAHSDEITGFLTSMGFSCLHHDTMRSIACEVLLESPRFLYSLNTKRSKAVRYISNLTKGEVHKMNQMLVESGYDPSLWAPENYDDRLSFVISIEDKIVACALMEMDGDDLLISFIYSRGSEKALSALLREIAYIIEHIVKDDSKILYFIENQKLEEFLVRLAGNDIIIENGEGNSSAVLMLSEAASVSVSK